MGHRAGTVTWRSDASKKWISANRNQWKRRVRLLHLFIRLEKDQRLDSHVRSAGPPRPRFSLLGWRRSGFDPERPQKIPRTPGTCLFGRRHRGKRPLVSRRRRFLKWRRRCNVKTSVESPAGLKKKEKRGLSKT